MRAKKPKWATRTNTPKKQPITVPPKATKPSRKRQPQPKQDWWDLARYYLMNYLVIVGLSGLILWLALIFSHVFDRF